MRKRWVALVAAIGAALLVVVCGGTPANAQPSNELDAATAQRLDSAVTDAMTVAAVPGAIVGIWGPRGHYVRAFGVADEATGAPMQVDFYSRIGSVTKTFTVTAVLQLADQGKVGLDDPIARYVENVPSGDAITLRELARMQSGLYNYTSTEGFQHALAADPRGNFTPQELLAWAFAKPAVFGPGQGFQYSNTNTILLGLVVEKVSGQPLPDYIHDHILAPLGMSHTSFPTTNAFPEPHPQGYTNTLGPTTTATDWDPTWAWAAGAMISTLDDMHIWAPALATGRLLSPSMQAQRLQTVGQPDQPPQDGYGLGIFNLGGWIGHNGSLPGYQAVSVYLPQGQTTLVILPNTDNEYQGGEPSTALANAITKIISPDHVYTLNE